MTYFQISNEVHMKGLYMNLTRQETDALKLTLNPQTAVTDFELAKKQPVIFSKYIISKVLLLCQPILYIECL